MTVTGTDRQQSKIQAIGKRRTLNAVYHQARQLHLRMHPARARPLSPEDVVTAEQIVRGLITDSSVTKNTLLQHSLAERFLAKTEIRLSRMQQEKIVAKVLKAGMTSLRHRDHSQRLSTKAWESMLEAWEKYNTEELPFQSVRPLVESLPAEIQQHAYTRLLNHVGPLLKQATSTSRAAAAVGGDTNVARAQSLEYIGQWIHDGLEASKRDVDGEDLRYGQDKRHWSKTEEAVLVDEQLRSLAHPEYLDLALDSSVSAWATALATKVKAHLDEKYRNGDSEGYGWSLDHIFKKIRSGYYADLARTTGKVGDSGWFNRRNQEHNQMRLDRAQQNGEIQQDSQIEWLRENWEYVTSDAQDGSFVDEPVFSEIETEAAALILLKKASLHKMSSTECLKYQWLLYPDGSYARVRHNWAYVLFLKDKDGRYLFDQAEVDSLLYASLRRMRKEYTEMEEKSNEPLDEKTATETEMIWTLKQAPARRKLIAPWLVSKSGISLKSQRTYLLFTTDEYDRNNFSHDEVWKLDRAPSKRPGYTEWDARRRDVGTAENQLGRPPKRVKITSSS